MRICSIFPFYKDTSRIVVAASPLVVANDLILADIFLHAITFLGLRDYSVSLEDALYLTTQMGICQGPTGNMPQNTRCFPSPFLG